AVEEKEERCEPRGQPDRPREGGTGGGKDGNPQERRWQGERHKAGARRVDPEAERGRLQPVREEAAGLPPRSGALHRGRPDAVMNGECPGQEGKEQKAANA